MANVLIIEDDDATRKVWRDALEEAGHQVCDAASGVQACARAQDTAFDVVVSDILMPEMDGIETLMALKQGASPPRFIVASGGGRVGSQVFLEIADRLGADVTLQKPVDLARLCREVEHLALKA